MSTDDINQFSALVIDYALVEIGPEGMTAAKYREVEKYAGSTCIGIVDNPATGGKTMILIRNDTETSE